MERDTDTPGKEFKVAIGGPVVTAAIVVVCVGLGLLLAGPEEFREAALTESGARTSGAAAVIAWLGTINLLVLIFNLVPAFPLDGGRIARAIAWRMTGDRGRATRFAATLGRGFAYILIALGRLPGLPGRRAQRDLAGGGRASSSTAPPAARSRRAGWRAGSTGLSVGDVMDREPVAIPEDATVERALDEFFLRYRYPWFPVIDGSSRFIGLLDQGTVDRGRLRRAGDQDRRRDPRARRGGPDGPRRRAAGVGAGERRAAAPRRPDGDRRRRPAQRRDHRRRRRPRAARARDRATRGLNPAARLGIRAGCPAGSAV